VVRVQAKLRKKCRVHDENLWVTDELADALPPEGLKETLRSLTLRCNEEG
jgi:hypothetical protein